MARSDKYGDERKAVIAKAQTRKNRRLKLRRKHNANLRDRGLKFSHKDAAYKGT